MPRRRVIGTSLIVIAMVGACSSSHKAAAPGTTAGSVPTSTGRSTTASLPPSTTTSSTLPRPRRTTTAVFPSGPIPGADLVFGDSTTAHRIVVSDADLDEVGLIVPTRADLWDAVSVSRDGVHLFVRKLNPADTSPDFAGSRCDQLYEMDLRTGARRLAVSDANVLSVSPDGTNAVVFWEAGCADPHGRPTGTTAVRDLATGFDHALDLSAFSVRRDQLAWSPDGSRFAVDVVDAGPPLRRSVRLYNIAGALVPQFVRPASSQDVVAWNANGLMLVDLGRDGTAVVRRYDPATGRPTAELGRLPQVELDGRFTPQVGQLFERGGTIYAPAAGGADTRGFAKIWVIRAGRVRLLSDAWSMHFVGPQS